MGAGRWGGTQTGKRGDAMATVMRDQAKPERAEANRRLSEAIFTDLDEHELDGFTYKVFRLADGVTFNHVWIEHELLGPTPWKPSRPIKPSWPTSPTAATSHR